MGRNGGCWRATPQCRMSFAVLACRPRRRCCRNLGVVTRTADFRPAAQSGQAQLNRRDLHPYGCRDQPLLDLVRHAVVERPLDDACTRASSRRISGTEVANVPSKPPSGSPWIPVRWTLVRHRQIRRPKPGRQRRLRVVKNGPGRQRHLRTTRHRLPSPLRRQVIRPGLAASGTHESVRPATRGQVLLTGGFGRELPLKLAQIPRKPGA